MTNTETRRTVVEALELSLALVKNFPPTQLLPAMVNVGMARGMSIPMDALAIVVDGLKVSGPNDPLLHAMTMALQSWDHATESWTQGTRQHSNDRRALVLQILGFDTSQREVINAKVLLIPDADRPIVIAEKHQRWYETRKSRIKSFYWTDYARQLQPPKGNWSSGAIGMLDFSVDDVIARLSDPTRPEVFAVKGLVMGYVQSGKTSHFSGLITKAADAGYRLVIVLAGTLDILRQQTQRRIDKEIVGKELLGIEEYGADDDWESFVSHGGLPSELGAFDWERLTNKDDDYRRLSRQLHALAFKAADKQKPFYDEANLRVAPGKIAVVKKVPSRLEKLCDDLEMLGARLSKLAHIPTLIIDDESDQASINIVDRNNPKAKEARSGTNRAIVRLLKLLPRAQYIGYTATPFANVFIDPEDAEDLFPKDFIVSLPRPDGYMGVADFFDFDRGYEAGDYHGNENAFVRPVKGDNELEENLPKAIDAFVLAGAIKLFRQAVDSSKYRFRHHTMLVHHAATQLVHDHDRAVVDGIFEQGARYQRPAGMHALENLFKKDFVPVSKARAGEDPFPSSFAELKPFIRDCIRRLCADKAVRIVNGASKNKDDTPDFDQNDVWAILVGGAKLSRGYTVEGLTVSYYRRPTGAGDTLMQMGRWFGFRQGYRDLVRLFIGRTEKRGKGTIDLYEAFGAVCRDEEALREDLKKYAALGITPKQVQPLVHQHMATLPPTSKNKRFNAQIKSQDFAGEWTEKTSAPSTRPDMLHNRQALAKLLASANFRGKELLTFVSGDGNQRRFTGFIADALGNDILDFLSDYRWAGGRDPIELEKSYIKREIHAGRLHTWKIILPQVGDRKPVKLDGGQLPPLAVVSRTRVSGSRFGAYSDPGHRAAAQAVAGVGPDVSAPNEAMAELIGSGQPVLLVYLVRETNVADVTVGFGIHYPGEKKTRPIVWSVRDPAHKEAVVVKV